MSYPRGMQRKCAKCGSTEGVTVYTVSAGADTAVIDLCDPCGRPIRELAEFGSTKPDTDEAPAPFAPRTHAVIPID